MASDETRSVLPGGSPSRLQLGLNLPTWEDRHGGVMRWPQLLAFARLIEQADIDTLWVPDHLQPRPDLGFWECWTVLAALAQATSRIALGPHVVCTSFRNPALLAKMAATLDEVCGGRLVLGLGSGLPELDASWRVFGYPTDRPVSRFAEAVEIIARLLREGALDFQGTYYRVRGCKLRPRGPRPAGPPIWVAAKGPRMLELAARWADAINYQAPGTMPAGLAEPFAFLDAACREYGREPATLLRTAYTLITFAESGRDSTGPRAQALHGSPEEIANGLHAFRRAGVQHLTCWIDAGDDPALRTFFPLLTPRGLERFVPVVAALRKLEERAAG